MPLRKGKSKSALSANIAELENSGHKPSQAIAIAYSEQDKSGKDSESAREYDGNGWAEIVGNPLSKVGVFPYLGCQISDQLEPNKIYQVYRPQDELDNQQTIDSFRLLPLVDEHEMLGENYTAAEDYGVHGVIGEDVYFEAPYLKANLKIFSNKLSDLINKGKRELSIGYKCLYELVSGVYDNQNYDAIQRSIRGNHLALVQEGRAGPDVAVLDHFKITFDTGSLRMAKHKDVVAQDGEITLDSLAAGLKKCMDALEDMKKDKDKDKDAKDSEGDPASFVEKAELTDGDDDDKDKKKAEDADEDKDDKKDAKDKKAKDADEDKEDKKSASMDAQIKDLSRQLTELKSEGTKVLLREISQRDALASKLSQHIGTFDHKDQTLAEVAAYGVKKLGLKCKPGHEDSVLSGYLAASRVATVAIALDTKPLSASFEAYLNGDK